MISIVEIQGKKIAVKGVGEAFYRDGLPIPISIEELAKNGISVSILHVADECLKNGWSPETVLKKFREDFADSMSQGVDFEQLSKFCHATYEDQREIIFKSLFTNEDEAKDHLRSLVDRW